MSLLSVWRGDDEERCQQVFAAQNLRRAGFVTGQEDDVGRKLDELPPFRGGVRFSRDDIHGNVSICERFEAARQSNSSSKADRICIKDVPAQQQKVSALPETGLANAVPGNEGSILGKTAVIAGKRSKASQWFVKKQAGCMDESKGLTPHRDSFPGNGGRRRDKGWQANLSQFLPLPRPFLLEGAGTFDPRYGKKCIGRGRLEEGRFVSWLHNAQCRMQNEEGRSKKTEGTDSFVPFLLLPFLFVRLTTAVSPLRSAQGSRRVAVGVGKPVHPAEKKPPCRWAANPDDAVRRRFGGGAGGISRSAALRGRVLPERGTSARHPADGGGHTRRRTEAART